MDVTIKRDRNYHVKILMNGELVLEFAGRVIEKRQSRGILGWTKEVDEELHVKDFDIIIGPALSRILKDKDISS